MSDLIKKIKIKKQDGTYTNYIPIGAEAKNIDCSDGESVEYKLNKKPYYYNNVADMKADTKLKVGDMAVTLGYYKLNDGGAGEYKIVNGNYDNNNGSYIKLNNDLFAEMIIREKINVKQFGAHGDGIHDDTSFIQETINYLKNIINKTRNVANNNLILFPAGQYKITSTIIIPTFIKIRSIGYTALLSSVSDGPCLHFTVSRGDVIESIATNQNFLRAPWIDGDAGFVIKYEGIARDNSIGIMIGSETNLGMGYQTSKFSMKNVHIQNCHIGLLFNPYHTYIVTIYEFNILKNDINIQFGRGEVDQSDSGERITFIDCCLSDANIILNYENAGWDVGFSHCSFDYSKCAVNLNNSQHHITFNQCHFEGLSHNVESENIPYGIIYGNMQNANNIIQSISISNSTIYKTNDKKLFVGGLNTYELILNNITFTAGLHDANGNIPFFIDKNIMVKMSNITYAFLFGKLPQNELNLLSNSSFNDCEIGVYNASNTNKIGSWDIYNNGTNNVDKTNFIISTESPIGEKSVTITPVNSNDNYDITLTSDFIPVEQNKSIIINHIAMNLNRAYNSQILFYDFNKNMIDSDTEGQWTPDYETESVNKWFISPNPKIAYIPRNCAFIKLRNHFYFKANTVGRIGGSFVIYK